MQYLREVIKRESGISLTEEKDYLLETRLLPLIRKLGLKDLSELVARIKQPGQEGVLPDIVDAMTTNETLFFRDLKPFAMLQERILPELLEAKPEGEKIHVLSAACSSGQEPYSLGMLLLESKGKLDPARLMIRAMDIDRVILKRAEEGLYTQFEVQRGLPIRLLLKHFTQEEERWRINEAVRKLVRFAPGNLLDAKYDGGPFDIILCRNVLIYFEQDLKKRVMANLIANLRPGGFLVIGSAETGFGLHPDIENYSDISGIYRYKGKS
jgi:chemotaxis protein methyltransferase CheR